MSKFIPDTFSAKNPQKNYIHKDRNQRLYRHLMNLEPEVYREVIISLLLWKYEHQSYFKDNWAVRKSYENHFISSTEKIGESIKGGFL